MSSPEELRPTGNSRQLQAKSLTELSSKSSSCLSKKDNRSCWGMWKARGRLPPSRLWISGRLALNSGKRGGKDCPGNGQANWKGREWMHKPRPVQNLPPLDAGECLHPPQQGTLPCKSSHWWWPLRRICVTDIQWKYQKISILICLPPPCFTVSVA